MGREQGGKRYFFNEIKGGTERTGVQRFGTRYVEINAVKDNFNFFYWMPFSNIKMLHLMPHFPFLNSQSSRRGSIKNTMRFDVQKFKR